MLVNFFTLLCAAAVGCAPVEEPWIATRASFSAVRAELADLRASGGEPYGVKLGVRFGYRDGPRMRARGAVAVAPPDAVRMVLLGPGGTTAFDLWLCRDAFRLAIPAIGMTRRGDLRAPEADFRLLPVAFLRWWFLRPYSGRLLFVADRGAARRFLLRDDDGALVDVVRDGQRVSARRQLRGEVETIDARGGRCGTVSYRQKSTGVAIEVECEGKNPAAPPARAFADPDDPSIACGGA